MLTNERLAAQSGVIAKRAKEIPLERVNDVTITQSILDRIVGAGDITLESAGEYGQETFNDVGHPAEVQKRIYEAAEARKGYAQQPAAGSVADELLKLSALRDKGALSPEEFEAQRRRLLGSSQFLERHPATHDGPGSCGPGIALSGAEADAVGSVDRLRSL